MQLASFRRRVASYLNRPISSFDKQGVDEILDALNDVRRLAQLSYSFNRLKASGFLQFGASAVDYTTGVVSAIGGMTPVFLKEVNSIWIISASSDPVKRCDILQIDEYNGTNQQNSNKTAVNFFLEGETLFCPACALVPTWFLVRGHKWLPDLTGAEPNDCAGDFFMKYGSSWALLAVCQQLNFFIKEDERVSITNAAVNRAWDALTFFDARNSTMSDHSLD